MEYNEENFNTLLKMAEENKLSIEKLTANNRALMSEKIKAREKADMAKEEERLKEEELLKTKGDTDSLKKMIAKLESDNKKLSETIQAVETERQNMKRSEVVNNLVSELGTKEARMLFKAGIKDRVIFEGGDIKFLDREGNQSGMTIDDFKEDIKSDESFAPVLVGIKASGTGSIHSSNSDSKVMKREAHDALSPAAKKDFLLNGGKLVD